MQKACAILYTLFYLTLSIGVHGTVHECMGQVTDWAWGHEELSCCAEPCHESPAMGGCCDNNEIEIWLVEEQLAQKEQWVPVLFPLALTGRCVVPSLEEVLDAEVRPIVPQAQKPPEQRLYLEHLSLQFYG